MKKIVLCIISLLIFNCATAQTYKLAGKVQDIKTGKGLSYATIKLIDGNLSTTSDDSGEYIIRLENGYSKFIISYIGYFSDTESVFVENKDLTRDIYLKPTEIFTKEIEVLGEDPAYEIIRKAIKYKKEFKKNLDEYNYDAYSKLIFRTNIAKRDKDSTAKSDKLPIFGILESETKGYFKKPDLEKQIVKSKRETANISRGVAIPLIVNFYDEKIDLGEIKIPGPVSDKALDDYEYKLIATSSMDSTIVYKIKVTNTSNLTPQFYGNIYIIDSSFALIKVDLHTNEAGNPRGIDNLNFKQKFSNFEDIKKNKFWMPTDIQIYADGSFAGLIKFQGEGYTIVSGFNLNEKAPAGIFDDIVIKVLPDASKKNSDYWTQNQLVKSSSEEIKAFKNIEIDQEKKSKSISFGLTSLNYGKNLSFDLLNLYRFNRIEGHQLKPQISYLNNTNGIFASASYAYGFSDKKSKYELSTSFKFLKDKSFTLSLNVFDKLNTLFKYISALSFGDNTFYCLFYKRDKLNYFYDNGFDLNISKDIIPQLNLTAFYKESKQKTALKNTDYSFFRTPQIYSVNPNINDDFKRTIGFSFRLNPNKYQGIDWGNGDVSKFPITEYPSLVFKFDYSGKKFNSTFENRIFELNFFGHNKFNTFLNFHYRIGGSIRTGEVPFQDLAFFNTSIINTAENMAFYVMDYNEYLGDKIYYLNLENNFGKLLWRNIPLLKSLDLITFFNAGRTELHNSNFNLIASKNFTVTDGIYMETGFAISRLLDLIRINFAWRLNNYKVGNNFIVIFTMG
jgi:hypothetical protein